MHKELWELSFMYSLKCGFIMCSSKVIKIKFAQGLIEHCEFCWKGSCAHISTSLPEKVKES